MDLNEKLEIKKLSEDDLLLLYENVQNHLQYLTENLISLTEEDGGEVNE